MNVCCVGQGLIRGLSISIILTCLQLWQQLCSWRIAADLLFWTGHRPVLPQVTSSSSAQTSKKGLYALAALLRNNADARALFYSNQGVQHLISLLKAPNQTEQVSLKVLNLVTDLSQLDLGKKVSDAIAAWRQRVP